MSLWPVIPKVTKFLLSNPVFTCIILAACMEIAVVAGFAAFLGKYLEQQFNLTTTSANQLLGLCSQQSWTSKHKHGNTHFEFQSNKQVLGTSLFWRYDSDSMCMSGDLHGRSAGEEAELVGAWSYPHGHASQPDLHCLLCFLPVPGLWHRSCRRSDSQIRQQARKNLNLQQPLLFNCHPKEIGGVVRW